MIIKTLAVASGVILLSIISIINQQNYHTQSQAYQKSASTIISPIPTPTVSLISLTPTPTNTPTPNLTPQNKTPLPQISAKAYQIYDINSDTVLAELNAHQPLPPASTTKIMTALISLNNYALNEIVTIPPMQTIGSKINLVTGERITVENLLYGTLLQSGNDAATALALHFPGGKQAFISQMNIKATQLGLEETNFVNPHGLHDPLHLSSASDLVVLAKTALNNPTFAKIVSTKTKQISSIDGQITHSLTNLNQLLGTIKGVKGVKTGWTEQAGEALVTLIERNNHPVLIAILASQERFSDTKKLIKWTYQDTKW